MLSAQDELSPLHPLQRLPQRVPGVHAAEKCVFDNHEVRQRTARRTRTRFEESMFHIIRAFHVAGRCTDCGECSRVCPQDIPLHLLNRKFIKDIDEFYGEYPGRCRSGGNERR